jgi:hypothetical protein
MLAKNVGFNKQYTDRDLSYQKHIDNKKSMRIVVNNCSVPRLVPYNRLMPFIKSIDIGKLYSVQETLCEGLNEEVKVAGIYRNIGEMLLEYDNELIIYA